MTIKTIFLTASYAVLLVMSSILGFLGHPTEMGLTILAGSLGLAFANIDKISKFKGAGFEAEMNIVHSLIESQTELTPEQQKNVTQEKEISDIDIQILKSLQHPKYTWRYANSVGDEVTLFSEETYTHLNSLTKRGLVRKGKGKYGDIWSITALGKEVHQQHEYKTA